MNRQDIAAAKAIRKSTLKSIKAKYNSRIKTIRDRAAEEIRQVHIQFSADPERLKAKYEADAAYKSEKAKVRAARALKRAQAAAERNARESENEQHFTFGEELFNSIVLGIGAGLAITALVLLIVKSALYASKSIYAITVTSYTLAGSLLFLAYLMSTLAHALTPYGAKRVFRILSYDFSYLSYTSELSLLALVFLTGTKSWILFSLDWIYGTLMVIAISSFKSKYRSLFMKILNVLMAITLCIEFAFVFDQLPVICVKLLIMALVTYLIGELFHAMKHIKWTNPIFHLFCMMANIFIFFALFLSLPM
ncbi:MAG: cell envelope integrity protein TolA [Treponema sp.]|nr:cell envelope integrity protein TolA [Treponema sp.]